MSYLLLNSGGGSRLELAAGGFLLLMMQSQQLSVVAPNPARGFSGSASQNFTFSIFDPLPGDTIVTPTSSLPGTWTPATLTLNAGTLSATATFTPSAYGGTTIGATGNNSALSAVPVTYKCDSHDYYLSATGSDSANGATTLTPWQTSAQIEAWGWVRGATYHFNGGDTFIGALTLADGVTGSLLADLITLTSYGTGRPILTVTSPTSTAVFRSINCGGIKLDNLRIIGAGDRPATTTQFLIHHHMTSSAAGVTLENFTITRCEISNGQRAIQQRTEVAGLSPKLRYINYTNNSIHTVWDRAICLGMLQTITGVNYTWVLDVVMTGNHIYNLDEPVSSYQQCFGIVLSYASAPIIQYNLCHDFAALSSGASCGVFVWGDTRNAVIAHNEIYNMRRISGDGMGINLDSGSQDCVVEFNYIHDCDGAGLGTYAYSAGTKPAGIALWRNNTFRYNVVQDCAKDHMGSFAVLGDDQDGCFVYNNVFVQSSTTAGTALVCYDSVYPATLIVNFRFYNNIFYAASNSVKLVNIPGGSGIAANTYFSNNAFFPFTGASQVAWFGSTYSTLAAWEAAAATVSGNLSSNPGLVAPTTEVIYNDPTRIYSFENVTPTSAASPVVNAGLDLTVAPYNYAGITRDYAGNPSLAGAGYDIGAIEFGSSSGALFISARRNQSGINFFGSRR